MELTLTGARLPAHEAPWARALRAPDGPLRAMADAAGGPFHVLHPGTFRDNVRAFDDVLRGTGVTGRIMFGHKANRSACFLRACAATGAGADVASVPEFDAALAAGLRGPDLVVTGPAKPTALLDRVLRHDALVAVDALDELDRLLGLARAGGSRARVLLRVLPDTDPASRFGLDPEALDEAVERCAAAPDAVETEGFSFHLSGYRAAPRAALAADLVGRCRAARRNGARAATISIGGGFAVDYVPEPDWRRFVAGNEDGWYHAGHRPPRFYPYHHGGPTGAAMLAAILDAPAGDGDTVAAALRASGVRLLLEPGRALLDRCGSTVFGVQGYKTRRDDHGRYGIVTVDGLSTSLSEQWKGSEFLPDPSLWSDREPAPDGPVVACVGGASCLEYDMPTWRKITFPHPPRFGDLLVYPNTAGYQMDKNETRFHGLPLPARFVLEDGDWLPETDA